MPGIEARGAQCWCLWKQTLFDVSRGNVQEAAQNLDVGVTTLKKICRANNIRRWPFRKRNSIDKLIEKTRMYMRADGPDDLKHMQMELTLDTLHVQRQALQVCSSLLVDRQFLICICMSQIAGPYGLT